MQQSALSGVADGVARDAARPSRATVEPFTVERTVACAWPNLAKGRSVAVWFSGSESFQVEFGDDAGEFRVWTTEKGLEAIVGACMVALVRARIAREQA